MRDPNVLAEFRRRRTRQWIASGGIIALLVPGMLGSRSGEFSYAGLPENVTAIGLLVAVLSVLVFSLWNWRCPACARYLGRTINPAYCSRCGAQLRE